jgi:FkbH-like protein
MTQEPKTNFPARSNLIVPLLVDVMLLLALGLPCAGASVLLALLLAPLGTMAWPAGRWLALAPLLYAVWLFLLLGILVLISSLLGTFHTKPSRMVWAAGTVPPVRMLICVYQYWLGAVVYNLPAVRLLLSLSVLKWLVYRACACRSRVSLDGTSILGALQDPDLIEIGSKVLVGDRSCLVAHSFTVDDMGANIFRTAPIQIAAGASVGGDVLIEPGVVIGAGAMVEPFSRVPAFTRIPAGEVWGGVPAVFLRHRDGSSRCVEGLSATETSREVLDVIAAALGVPRETITPESGSSTVGDWDSLGRMAIAAALETSLGVNLPVERIFALNSVAQIQEQLRELRSAADSGPPAPLALSGVLPRDPELLPLMEVLKATALLLASPPPVPTSIPSRVVVASTFVAEPLAPALRLWCHAFGLAVEVRFADFNQVVRALLDPGGPFGASVEALHIVLCRPEDLCTALHPDGLDPADAIFAAIESFTATGGRLLVGDLPPVVSRRFTGDPAAVAALSRRWRERLEAVDGVRLFPFSDLITKLGLEGAADPALEERASTPYRSVLYQLLGASIAREVRRRRVPAKKVVALDGDNTLWGGVLGEDGPDGLVMGSGFAPFQQRLRRLREQGVLLTLVSKNEESDLLQMLRTHPDATLRPEDFVAHRIGWADKSNSLNSLAVELNLGLDSFVFVDDNPVERAAVEARWPEITVLPLPADPADYSAQLDRLWCFDGIGASEEDRRRSDMLEEERRRRLGQTQSTDLASYLQSLELSVTLRSATEADHPRLAQLTQRTNQFNLSYRRRNEDEVARLAAGEAMLWVVSTTDRFGDYGLVGAVILMPGADPGTGLVDTFVLSCRALGRGVEEAMLHGVCREARERGLSRLEAPYVVAPRNTPVREFFQRQQWQEQKETFNTKLDTLPELPIHVNLRVG